MVAEGRDNQHLDEKLAEAYRALGSPTRLHMLRVLSERERFCGDLVKLFHLSQSTVSHHLKALREAELITAEERGAATCYRINRTRVDELETGLHDLCTTRRNNDG